MPQDSQQTAHLLDRLQAGDTKTMERVEGVEDIAFSPDGRYVAVVHDGGKIAGLELES